MKEYYRVKAEINLDAIHQNITETKARIGKKTKLMAVVKADGYGHGAIPVARVLRNLADYYGVAIMEEGLELRRAGIEKPILILGFTPQEQLNEMLENELMATVYNFETAEKISKQAVQLNKTAKIHIKVDTGMARLGFPVSMDSVDKITEIAKLPYLFIDGCFSHFSKADETDKTYAKQQLADFLWMNQILEQRGVLIPVRHISNSAGIIDLPEANLDMVRSGISTYGLYPSDEVDKSRLALVRAMEVKAYLSFVKTVKKGTMISYNGTYITDRDTKVATIPVGYADGYPRALSNQGRVLIHGQTAPILGRVCMDQFMVDVTEIESVEAGDEAVLVGGQGAEYITMEELGKLSYSFHYEAVCDFGKRIPRVYYLDGKKVGTCDFYRTAKCSFDLLF